MRREKAMPNRADRGRPARVVLAGLSLLLILAAALGVGSLALVHALDRAPASLAQEGEPFTVEPGEPALAVARRLAAGGLIRSELAFRLILKVRGLESSLQAGSYRVRPGMSGTDVMDMLAAGRQELARLRVPEGAGLRAVARAAEEAGVASADAILAAAADPALAADLGLPPGAGLEGYLFPDTYFLPLGAGAEAVLRLMVGTFRERLGEAVPESSALSAAELHRGVILASIIEREYRVPEEAPVMASVFANRLRIGMALQSCATVVYVITERQGKPHPERLFDRDLDIVDPYNTYGQPGLPPGPICNPGIVALAAAFRPERTGYLYFRLVDGEGGRHYFSETLDEHIRAGSLAVKPRSP